MVTKAKKALLASLAAFLCVMLTVFGLSMSVSTAKIAKADDTTAVAQIGEAGYELLPKQLQRQKTAKRLNSLLIARVMVLWLK